MRYLLAGVAISLLVKEGFAASWSPQSFPNPSTPSGAEACGRKVERSAICDPDRLLSVSAANTIEGIIRDIAEAKRPYASAQCTPKVKPLPGFKVAVALMRKMEISSGINPFKAAQDFAVDLFEAWGVGDAGCDNGLLMLLSTEDRQVYIRGGSQAMKFAPEQKLKGVTGGMKRFLREGNYDEALKQGVVDLGLALAGADLPEPSGDKEDNDDVTAAVIFYGIFASILGFIGWKNLRGRHEENRCRKLLDKLRREQQFAQRTKTYPAKSCPVCFEDFKVPLNPDNRKKNDDDDLTDGKDTKASLKEKGKRKGNSENSFNEASNPLLSDESRQASTSKDESAADENDKPFILPCGHTFCHTCISRWLEKNSTCPVCRKRLDGNTGDNGNDDNDDNDDDSNDRNRRQRRRDQPSSSTSVDPSDSDRCIGTTDFDDTMYASEVHYRMRQLHRWYPTWVTMDMVNQAQTSSPTEAIVDWNAVRDEQLASQSQHHHEIIGQQGSNFDFGGGTSHGGGGAGDSW